MSLALAALSLLASLAPATNAATRFENIVAGHELRLPAGWRAVVGDDGATRITWRSLEAGVRIELIDHVTVPRSEAPPEGTPIRLGPELGREGVVGPTHVVSFRRGGHVFETIVGGNALPKIRERIVELLESVRLTARGRAVANVHSLRVLGRSSAGRPIRAWRIGNPRSPRRILVVGCIHGNECAGMAVTQRLVNLPRPIALDLWIVQNLNPDGLASGQRGNAHGADLNRDFLAGTQRETRIARKLILRIRPDATIWFHQPQALVRAWGRSRATARRYARLAGMPYRSLVWPPGAATRWQNGLGQTAFVVELPRGALSSTAARHARAILRLGGEPG
ncbi:MAG: DUF2817 domain-containing protein [Gaiellaceae bacterium MAG52_C11]|nr:DUF2817 domain-containing protein [Candidatus Gaiellasilicea maunaloa]